MRILVSGGMKTQNIIKGIEKKFTASGDDFLVVEFIENINDIFARGDYFDKAIITEQSITREYSITDEYEIRQRINKFALESAAKHKRSSFVFLTQTEEMANMIHEEILPIMNDSVVVLKKPPYLVTFFVSIIVSDISRLPEEIVYTPTINTDTNSVGDRQEQEEFIDMEVEETYRKELAPTDFDAELFEFPNAVSYDNEIVSDEIQITGSNVLDEEELNIEIPNDYETDSFKNNNYEAKSFETEDFTPYQFENNSSNTFSNDAIIETDYQQPIKQSGEIPNYIVKQEEKQLDNGFLAGFDEDYDNSKTYEEETIEYGSHLSDVKINDTQGVLNKLNKEAPSFIKAEETMFNTNDFDTAYQNDQFNGLSNQSIGFDSEDYSEDDSEANEDYQNSISESMYTETEEAAFNIKDYQEDESNKPNELQEQAAISQNTQTKKVGLFNKFKRNNVSSEAATPKVKSKGTGIDIEKVKKELKPFAARGNSIVVTGCGGCGTSTVAYNLSNIVAQLGYTVLLVDMDTEGRTQSYISKSNYDSMEPEGANLMSAVNGSNGINTHISVVKQGFHLLTMGLGADSATADMLLHKEKLARFVNLAKSSHNFVIYDIPFQPATCHLSDVIYMTDNLVLVTDASNWGITKTMLSVCNITSTDMQDTVFNRAQIVFNKYRNLYRVLGKKVKTCTEITKVMDQKVLELIGEDPDFHFEDLHIAGIINDDPDFENGWFEEVQYSDTKKGQEVFLGLLEKIVLTK